MDLREAYDTLSPIKFLRPRRPPPLPPAPPSPPLPLGKSRVSNQI